jgi:hypothetical protein
MMCGGDSVDETLQGMIRRERVIIKLTMRWIEGIPKEETEADSGRSAWEAAYTHRCSSPVFCDSGPKELAMVLNSTCWSARGHAELPACACSI